MSRYEEKIKLEVIRYLEENGFCEAEKLDRNEYTKLEKQVAENAYLSVVWMSVLSSINIVFTQRVGSYKSENLIDITLTEYLLFELDLILKNIDMFILCCNTYRHCFKYIFNTSKNGNSFHECEKDGRLYLSSNRLRIVIDEYDCVIYSTINDLEDTYLY